MALGRGRSVGIVVSDRPRRVVAAAVDPGPDGFVLFDDATGRVHHLNATAVAVLGLCSGERSVGEIIRLVGDAFGLGVERIDAVESCLGILRAESLVA